MHRALRVLSVCLLGLALWAPVSYAQEAEDVDRVVLAARLISDGYWERAERVLAEVDLTDDDVDLGRFHLLRGLVRARSGLHEQAIEDFQAALALPEADPLIYLHVAQSEIARGAWLLRARAHRDLDDLDGAWVALTQGAAVFPEDDEFPRQQVFLLVEMGLFQTALVKGRALLAERPDDEAAWLAFSEALRNAGELTQAVLLLEEARLRFPTSTRVATLLARLYLRTDRPKAAAGLLQIAAETDASLFAAAAEASRQAGDLSRALYLNGRVPDPVEKAKQRLGLYIGQQDWARAVALEERLNRLGLLEEDALRYAVAYAWFQLGDHDRSETFLAGISDPKWFRDATALRDAMAQCREDGGCL